MISPARTRAVVFAAATLSAGCFSQPLFRDEPPVWRVHDDANIEEPVEHEFSRKEYYTQVFLSQRLDRALSLPDQEPAWNTNAFDEVPDSSWFQNRIGVRSIPPAEAAAGPVTGGPPEPPFEVTGGKAGGGTRGLTLRDRTGRKFLVKFDRRANPELGTAAGVIVGRVFWVLGYNVPSDTVFELDLNQLSIAAGAKYKNPVGDKLPLDMSVIQYALAPAPPGRNGRYRALASQLLDGKPKGGFSATGTREDDPNDIVPHQHRRELRGMRVFAAWLGHTDIKEDNTLDLYVSKGERRYLKHYLIDFDAAFNSHAAEFQRPDNGWEYMIDWEAQTKATLAFGLWHRPWEDAGPAPWPSVGWFKAAPFDPEAWHETYPFAPFMEMDPADAYWAAKLVMKFDRLLLTALVAEGRLSNPHAAQYLVDTLLARRDAIGRAFLDAVTPLDEIRIDERVLCLTDLSVRHGLARPSIVEWLKGSRVVAAKLEDAQGRVCVKTPPDDDYVFYRLRVRRGEQTTPPMEVHFKGGRAPRLLGIVRVTR
jgi:hypothetical protein